jgi:integration host factor subunit beta
MTVIKSELVDRISVQNPHLYRYDAEKIINTVFLVIAAAMARGDRVELRGFGVFFVKFREGRDEILARGLWFRANAKPFPSSGAAGK